MPIYNNRSSGIYLRLNGELSLPLGVRCIRGEDNLWIIPLKVVFAPAYVYEFIYENSMGSSSFEIQLRCDVDPRGSDQIFLITGIDGAVASCEKRSAK